MKHRFTAFKHLVWPDYRAARHLSLLDKHLEQVALYLLSGGMVGLNRLMIFMPPRYGKSTTASHYFPAWVLGELPTTRLIMVSYGNRLALRNSRRLRTIVRSAAYQALYPTTVLSHDKQAMDEWELEGGGGVVAAGVGGGITGHGANLIIIDDPIKSREEAESVLHREQLQAWYTADLYTRLEKPNALVLMMTRWHYHDLAGWLLSDNVDGWRVLSLSALAAGLAHPTSGTVQQPGGHGSPSMQRRLGAEINSLYDWRWPGEALWPEHHTRADLLHIQHQLGDYDFSALYQQAPLPERGRLFDPTRIGIVDTIPLVVRAVRFYDLAVTAKTRASYTAGVKLGLLADERLIVLDVWRGQIELPDVHEAIVQHALLDGATVPIRLEAEKAGIVELQHLLREPRLHGYRLDAEPPRGDKYTRAGPIAARVNAGRVLMLRAAWNRAFLEELGLFPHGPNADQIDALSGAYRLLHDAQGLSLRLITARGLYDEG